MTSARPVTRIPCFLYPPRHVGDVIGWEEGGEATRGRVKGQSGLGLTTGEALLGVPSTSVPARTPVSSVSRLPLSWLHLLQEEARPS